VVSSVVGHDLVDPGVELANLSIYGRYLHIAVSSAPGDNTNKHPHIPPSDRQEGLQSCPERKVRSQIA
jgi:hypothetical protein